ncbi:hypothetical protein HDV05_001795, partial [Chytridiales sp. JEL 0842]
DYKLGDPFNSTTNLGPVISVQAANQIRAQIAQAVSMGAKLHISTSPLDTPSSAFVTPQILTNVNHGMQVMTDETFGPVMPVMKVSSDEEALKLMNDSKYGLTASIWTKDPQVAQTLGESLECGTVFVNRCDFLEPKLPWGGWKESGRGVSLGVGAFDACTRWKGWNFRGVPVGK